MAARPTAARVDQAPDCKGRPSSAALELRVQGWSVNDIAVDLGVARSTAWQWVRHLPLDPDSERARMKREKGRQLTDGRWKAHRVVRDAHRQSFEKAAAVEVGALSDREILMLGAAIYWSRAPRRSRGGRTTSGASFTNSDPDLIAIFLRVTDFESQGHAGAKLRPIG